MPLPSESSVTLRRPRLRVRAVCYTVRRSWEDARVETYGGLLFLMLIAAGNAAIMIALQQWIGPKVTAAKGKIFDTPYETGVDPEEVVRGRFSVKFFVVALLFILFDVELIFLFPWAVVFKELGWFAFWEMLVFLGVVVAGLYYSIKKGAMQWD